MDLRSYKPILNSDQIDLTFENERLSNLERYHTEEEENGEAPKDLWKKRYFKSLTKQVKIKFQLDQDFVIETQSAKKKSFVEHINRNYYMAIFSDRQFGDYSRKI